MLMQDLRILTAKRDPKILEFSSKPKQMPVMTLDEFLSLRMTGVRRIRDPDAMPAIPKPYQILEFRRNEKQE